MDGVFRPGLFQGKSVLVTGGATGIGFAIADAFAGLGAGVHLLSRDEGRLRAAAARLPTPGPARHAWHACDVRDAARVEAVAAQLGAVDVLVNAAAGNFPAPFSALSENAFNSVVDIVLKGTANVSRSVGGRMQRGAGGAIVNVVAGYAWTGAPGVSHSGAAKAGVLNLTKSLAVEWAPKVRANAVSPGPIDGTEGMKRLGDDLGLRPAVERSVPLGRMGTPDEVAQACVFLASPAASYVTGACLVVDGGQDAKGPFGGLLLG
jgi:NAD(P)-dependent dehydrogenase (short-subunit alcohol dehydrogenase family)